MDISTGQECVRARHTTPRPASVTERPVHPLHQLLILLPPEDAVALVQNVQALTVRHQLTDLLSHLGSDRKCMRSWLTRLSRAMAALSGGAGRRNASWGGEGMAASALRRHGGDRSNDCLTPEHCVRHAGRGPSVSTRTTPSLESASAEAFPSVCFVLCGNSRPESCRRVTARALACTATARTRLCRPTATRGGAQYLIEKRTGQRRPPVQGHGDAGGHAVSSEPGPLVCLGTARQGVELQVTGQSYQDLQPPKINPTGTLSEATNAPLPQPRVPTATVAGFPFRRASSWGSLP